MSAPNCPKCGSPMTGGAPHGDWPVQWECQRCGIVVVPRSLLAELQAHAKESLRALSMLARIGRAMRKAQQNYFEAKKAGRYLNHTVSLKSCQREEQRFDAAVTDALNRERQTLPGMEGGEP